MDDKTTQLSCTHSSTMVVQKRSTASLVVCLVPYRVLVVGLLAILCFFLLPTPVQTLVRVQADNPEDIQNFLQILPDSRVQGEIGAKREISHSKQPIAVMWGIADTTATVGRLFSHTLPEDAFKGHVTGYKVSLSTYS